MRLPLVAALVAAFPLSALAQDKAPARPGTPEARLLEAARDGRVAEAKALLAAGADVEAFDDEGCTVLVRAAYSGDAALVGTVLDAGADVNTPEKEPRRDGIVDWRDTPLTVAARLGSEKVVELLLARGAKIESANAAGQRALMLAAGAGRASIVARLLADGANRSATDASGRDALIHAALGWSAGAPVQRLDAALLLLRAGAEPSAADKEGRTALWWAVINGDADMAMALLLKGASPNAADQEGNTPLIQAVQSERPSALSLLLLQKGADPLQPNTAGKSALDFAKASGNDALVGLLERRGQVATAPSPALEGLRAAADAGGLR